MSITIDRRPGNKNLTNSFAWNKTNLENLFPVHRNCQLTEGDFSSQLHDCEESLLNATHHLLENLSLEWQENTTFPSNLVFPSYIRVVSTFFCVLVLVVGVLGNLLVPLVLLRNKDMRNSTNFFLLNLSLADLMVLIVCLPSALYELHSPPEVWLLGKNMCE